MTKNCLLCSRRKIVCYAPYLRNRAANDFKTVYHDCNLWYTSLNDNISRIFFSFFQNFDFLGCWKGHSGKKWPKMTKNSIYGTLYSETIHHIIFIYVTYVKKDNISRYFLHFFQILIFRVKSGVKGQKLAQNDKNCLLHSISGIIHHMIMIFGFDM